MLSRRPERPRRLQPGHLRHRGATTRGATSSSKAARTGCSGSGHREPGPDPHVSATVTVLPEAEEVDVADRPQRPPDRRLPLLGARRAERQHHRLGGAASPTSPPASSWRCRTSAARSRTGRGRCRCCGPACCRPSRTARRPSAAERRAQVGGGGAVREDPDLQLQGEPGHRPPHRPHALPAPGRARRRPRRGGRPLIADERARQLAGTPVSARPPGHLARSSGSRQRRLDGIGRRGRWIVRGGPGLEGEGWWRGSTTGRPGGRSPARRHGRAAPGRRAAAVRARALGVPAPSTCSSTAACSSPGPRPSSSSRWRSACSRGRRAAARGRRPRHRVGSHRPLARRRAARWPASRCGPPMRRPTPSTWPGPTWPASAGPARASAGRGRLVRRPPADCGPARPRGVEPALVAEHDECRRGAATGSPPRPSSPAPMASTRSAASSAASPGWLAPGGWLVTEIGATQGDAVAALACDAGLVDVEVRPT